MDSCSVLFWPTEFLLEISSSILSLAIPPGPLRNVTVTGCSIDGETNNTSLQVAWQLPEMSFGKLVNCSFNISVMEDTMENATLLFVNGASEVRNTGVRIQSYTRMVVYRGYTSMLYCVYKIYSILYCVYKIYSILYCVYKIYSILYCTECCIQRYGCQDCSTIGTVCVQSAAEFWKGLQ